MNSHLLGEVVKSLENNDYNKVPKKVFSLTSFLYMLLFYIILYTFYMIHNIKMLFIHVPVI